MDKRFPIEDQIEMLGTALKGRVVTSKDADYDELRAVALANFDEYPAAIIRVANAADVAAVLNFVQASDLPHFVGGPIVFAPTPEVLAGFAALSAAAPEELTTIGYVMPLPPVPFVPAAAHFKLAFVAMLAYSGDPAKAEAAIAPFRQLGTPMADLVGPVPYTTLYMLDPPPEMKSAVSIRSRFINSFGLTEATAMLKAMNACDAPMKMAQIRMMGGAFSRVPANATAFAHRSNSVLVAFLAMHAPGTETKYDAWAGDAMASLGMGGNAYVNFLSAEGNEGLSAAYPLETLARLRQVKRRYDPENLFRRNQNIAPAA